MKLSELSTNPSLSTDDLLYVVDNPGGTPNSYKTTIGSVLGLMDLSDYARKSQANTFTASGNVFAGTTIFRQSSGTAGTHELQHSHTGTLGLIENKSGYLYLRAPAGQGIGTQVGSETRSLQDGNRFVLRSDGGISFANNTTFGSYITHLSQNTSGGILLEGPAGAVTQTIKMASGQTTDAFQVQDSTGAKKVFIGPDRTLFVGNNTLTGTPASNFVALAAANGSSRPEIRMFRAGNIDADISADSGGFYFSHKINFPSMGLTAGTGQTALAENELVIKVASGTDATITLWRNGDDWYKLRNNAGVFKVLNTSDGEIFGLESTGRIRTNQTATATTPGSVTKKLPIYDTAGTLMGYVPLYDTIT